MNRIHDSLQQVFRGYRLVFRYDAVREWRKTFEPFQESRVSKLTIVRKEREKLQKALKDCQDWERDTLLPLAQKRIDLDDGVKVNYLKFGDALAPIHGLAAKEEH